MNPININNLKFVIQYRYPSGPPIFGEFVHDEKFDAHIFEGRSFPLFPLEKSCEIINDVLRRYATYMVGRVPEIKIFEDVPKVPKPVSPTAQAPTVPFEPVTTAAEPVTFSAPITPEAIRAFHKTEAVPTVTTDEPEMVPDPETAAHFRSDVPTEPEKPKNKGGRPRKNPDAPK